MMSQVLATELQQPQYIGMTDAEIVAALNAVSASTRRAVPLAALAGVAVVLIDRAERG